jgi:putative FmdB family regulatory protein
VPLYEYVCLDCEKKFDSIRSAATCDSAECEGCGSRHTRRLLSRFVAHSKGGGGSRAMSGGAGCGGCGGGHCGSCHAQ